jgi:hypothetical protein
MERRILIIAFFLALLSGSLFGGASPSEWDSYCRKCHIDRPVNSLYDPSAKAHLNASFSCVACHRDKGISGHMKKSAESFRLLFQEMTLPPAVRPSQTSYVKSDDCLACHAYIRDEDEIPSAKLPKALRQIKLRAAHGQHLDYRAFTAEQRDKLKFLTAKGSKSSLPKAEQAELDRISGIEKMQCSRCHERFKKDSPGGVDPNVNMAMKNPMECTVCHISLRNSIHPGDTPPLPSAVTCERCHNGKLHQKAIFFAVDCTTNSECLKCHPGYDPDELLAVRPDAFIHKSTMAIRSGQWKNRTGNRVSNLNSYEK